jgi:hypothetical protein
MKERNSPMTIRYAINNDFYRAEIEKFAVAMFFKKLTTTITERDNVIAVVVAGDNVNASTTFEGWEHIFVK